MNDDAALVAPAQSGDRSAFNRLVARYQDRVYGLCLRLTGDPDTADDAAQETFIAAYRHLQDFRGGSFPAWLMRIATRRCYDVHRRRQRRPSVSLDRPGRPNEETEGPAATLPDPQPGPEAAAEGRELAAVLQAGLLTLPPDQRTALTMCDVLGYDYQTIAESTQVPLGTVRSRINRGRRRLREYLAGQRELLPHPYRHAFSEKASLEPADV